MDTHVSRLLNPDEQIAEVRASLTRLRNEPDRPGRDQELRDAQAYLDQLLTMHARGELEPLAFNPAGAL
ncbi:MAG TPA: hypothetical protein VMU89_16980 [Thermomicrobiaceae bacterium]|nr:hypothetical protein [Thermomicrobiaceae bacterium]